MGVIGALCWRQGGPGFDDVVQSASGIEILWNFHHTSNRIFEPQDVKVHQG
jgi:hypothetical protein